MTLRFRLAPTSLTAASRNQWQPNDGTNSQLTLLAPDDVGTGANALTTGCIAAANCACAGTDALTAWPLAVAFAGATIVTFVTFVTFVTLATFVVLLLMFVELLLAMLTCMPTLMMGGALVTTAGDVPMGAGTIRPT